MQGAEFARLLVDSARIRIEEVTRQHAEQTRLHAQEKARQQAELARMQGADLHAFWPIQLAPALRRGHAGMPSRHASRLQKRQQRRQRVQPMATVLPHRMNSRRNQRQRRSLPRCKFVSFPRVQDHGNLHCRLLHLPSLVYGCPRHDCLLCRRRQFDLGRLDRNAY